MSIVDNVRKILKEIPESVTLLAAAKGRSLEEVRQAIEAGVKIIGENYVQETERIFSFIGRGAEWHFIGHLQKNKVKKAVKFFDVIETVDSLELAAEIDYWCYKVNRIMPVFIEINIGREQQKTGIFPEFAVPLIKELSTLPNIKVSGLMTMGPVLDNPEEIRPFFRETYRLFTDIQRLEIQGVQMKYLSMGMSDTYKMAIEEGANIIRIGNLIFGPGR